MRSFFSLYNPSSTDLLAQVCQADDTLAFKLLYERYWEKLFVLAFRKVHSEADASDIVQNIMVKLWEKRQDLHISKSLDGYLFISLKNAVLNYYKNKFVKKKHESLFGEGVSTEEEVIYSQILYKELHSKIDGEIRHLPEKMREVFVLSRSHNLSAKQIAHKLSISEQTVRNQISDAVHRIRVRITEG